MKKHLALISCLLLAGCTDADWDNALNYAHLRGAEDAPDMAAASVPAPERTVAPHPTVAATSVAAAPAAPAPSENDFCRAVATKDATDNGFDPATQQRVLAQSYAQCVAIYSR